MTADTGTVWARGISEPANDALFGGHFADQAAYAIVNAGCAWYRIPVNTKVIHRNS
jgi:hypothetical protein